MKQRILINNKDVYLCVFILLIKVLLDTYYTVYVTNIWGYEGYTLSVKPFRVFISYLFLSIFYLFAIFVKKKNNIIYFLYILLIIIYLIPNLTTFAYADADIRIIIGIMIFLSSVAFSVYLKFKFNFESLTINKQKKLLVILLISCLILFFIRYRFQIFPRVLIFQDIYEAREVFGNKSTILHDYMLGWLVKIIAPVGLIWGLINKKKFIVLLSVLSLIYIYLLSGHKSVFVTVFVMIFIYYLKGSVQDKIYLVVLGILLFILVVPLIDTLIGTNLFTGIFITRLFFMPSLLNECYFDFFDDNYMHLSYSVFSVFFEYPYDLLPANKIGLEYFNRPDMMANNGVVSDAFMNFGFIGIIIFSLIIFLFLVYINSFNIDDSYLGLFVIFALLFVSSPFLTFFLTHGVLLFIILLPLLMQNMKKIKLHK